MALLDYTSPYFDALGIGDDSEAAERLIRYIAATIAFAEKFCRRKFALADYTDIGISADDGSFVLRNNPLQAIWRVCCGWGNYVTISGPAGAQIANYSTDHSGNLYLNSVSSGTPARVVLPLTGTLQDLATAINGAGWVSTIQSNYGSFPAADVVPGQYGSATMAAVGYSPAQVYVWQDYQGVFDSIAPGQNAAPITCPGVVQGLPRFVQTRVDYRGGFATLPSDLAQCLSNITISQYNGGRELKTESLQGWSYTYFEQDELTMSDKKILSQYRERLYQ
jgi:hypothetical protein